MNLFKHSCLMAGGAAFVHAGEDFSAGRFWSWILDMAVIAALLYLSKPSKEGE